MAIAQTRCADIEAARARIRDLVAPTPCPVAYELEDALGHRIAIKAELLQRTGSFKARGALNWIRTSTTDERRRGLITVSAGNHAKALAWAAREAGTALTVLMPRGSSPLKVAATRALGAEVILHGQITQTLTKMAEIQRERDLVLVHPYDDPRIIAGQGTVGLEIVKQCPQVGVVVCPVGGGGLISGIAVAIKETRPEVRVIGVEPEGAATLSTAWRAGKPIPLPRVETLAMSLGAGIAGDHTYALSRRHVDEIVTVSEDELRTGFELTLTGTKFCAEPGAAVGVAAIAAGKVSIASGETAVCVLTGGNLDLCTLSELTS